MVFSTFPYSALWARFTILLIRAEGFLLFFEEGEHIFSCRQLAQGSSAKSLFSPTHKGVCEHVSPRPSVSGSLPLPCPLKTSNVFFTQLCAGLCVQACVAFPLTRIQSQQHTPLPCTLRPRLSPQLQLLLLLCFVVECVTSKTQVCSTLTCEIRGRIV